MAISDSEAVDVPKGEKWTKSKNWGGEKESVLSVQVFFNGECVWRVGVEMFCRALWDNKQLASA